MSAPITSELDASVTALIPVRSSVLLDLVGEYSTIVADPPWDVKFGEDTRRAERASTGSPKGTWTPAAMNYNTMTLDEIKALPVANAAAENAHLYIWTINAYIEQTYAVARAWSFRPVALLTWAKTPRGLGFGGASSRRPSTSCSAAVDSTSPSSAWTRRGGTGRDQKRTPARNTPASRKPSKDSWRVCHPDLTLRCSPVGNATDGTCGVTRSNNVLGHNGAKNENGTSLD